MANNFASSETYSMSSSLTQGPEKNYFISSFIIALPGGVNIGLIHTQSTIEKVKKPDGSLVDQINLIFVYQAFNDKFASNQELTIKHPKIYGESAAVEIIVKDIGGGGTSTVKDVVLPD